MSNAITTLADGGSGLPLFELLLLLPPVAATTIRITARTRATRSPFLRGDRRPNQLQTRLTFASDHLGGIASCRDQTLRPWPIGSEPAVAYDENGRVAKRFSRSYTGIRTSVVESDAARRRGHRRSSVSRSCRAAWRCLRPSRSSCNLSSATASRTSLSAARPL